MSDDGIRRPLRRVSVVVLGMFGALLTATSLIQVGVADDIRGGPYDRRTQLANQNVNRGPILVEGEPVAYSVETDGEIVYQRVYTNGPLYATVTGAYLLEGESTGLEAAYDDYLTGSTGGQFLDQLGAVLTGKKPEGAAVETTIDASLQQVAWDALGDYTGAIIVLEPDTGRILADVSKPTYDPNTLAVHDIDLATETKDALAADPSDPLIDRATNGDLDPPGSTFKLVVAAAALESGEYTPDSTFPNPSSLQLPQSDSVIRNADGGNCGGGSTVTLADAIRLSCNIPMAELAAELGYVDIKEQAKEFGFCRGFDVAGVLPDVQYGCTPQDVLDLAAMYTTPSTYPAVLDEPQTMLSAFGQYGVRASPLQMAMVSAAIANGGELMAPTLVDSVIGPDLTTLLTIAPRSLGQPISASTASELTAMMVSSVESGAASGAQLDGVSVAGKTGTAENDVDDPYTLWFTGFAPAENPQAVVAVVLQDGAGLGQDGTSRIAAEIGARVLEAVVTQ